MYRREWAPRPIKKKRDLASRHTDCKIYFSRHSFRNSCRLRLGAVSNVRSVHFHGPNSGGNRLPTYRRVRLGDMHGCNGTSGYFLPVFDVGFDVGYIHCLGYVCNCGDRCGCIRNFRGDALRLHGGVYFLLAGTSNIYSFVVRQIGDRWHAFEVYLWRAIAETTASRLRFTRVETEENILGAH